jgi:hypothetical protein
MNGTSQCYDDQIASPGWSFFGSDPLPDDDQLGIAQLSNRLLIPPDGLPFAGQPDGALLGYAWMALPLMEAKTGDQPTGEHSWTCFLNAANFKGSIAFYATEPQRRIGSARKARKEARSGRIAAPMVSRARNSCSSDSCATPPADRCTTQAAT